LKITLVAVGQKMPAWADAAYEDYAKRFPPEFKLELKAVKAEPRGSGKSVEQMMAAEAARIEAALPKGAFRVVLDERGTRLSTLQMAERCRGWLGQGGDVAVVIGGPDGLHPSIKESAQDTWRLSDLTLPHAMVRVLLAEALYRAWTVIVNHPYHRE
jgi:23S rRNA (pseudouridine1915-N3)-methyltransferase